MSSLFIPLSTGEVAIPRNVTPEDLDLVMDTLQLWRSKLTGQPEKAKGPVVKAKAINERVAERVGSFKKGTAFKLEDIHQFKASNANYVNRYRKALTTRRSTPTFRS